MGGEDAELSTRLKNEGKIVRSQARSIHLHYMAKDYNLLKMMKSRKMSARSYGRFLRKSALLAPRGSLTFLIRPALAILPLIPGFQLPSLLLMVAYTFLYSQKMFTSPATRSDPRIILIPILNIFFLYYELFWMLEAFFVNNSNL